ncbi:MAG: DUF2892 domain-containing protein [Chitinophagaceae bacterium]
MKKNMAIFDRFLRMLVSIILVVLYFKLDIASPWNYIMLAVAGIFIISSFFGVCPLYSLLGIDTRQFKENDKMA